MIMSEIHSDNRPAVSRMGAVSSKGAYICNIRLDEMVCDGVVTPYEMR